MVNLDELDAAIEHLDAVTERLQADPRDFAAATDLQFALDPHLFKVPTGLGFEMDRVAKEAAARAADVSAYSPTGGPEGFVAVIISLRQSLFAVAGEIARLRAR